MDTEYAAAVVTSGWVIVGVVLALMDALVLLIAGEHWKTKASYYVRRSWFVIALLVVVAQYFAHQATVEPLKADVKRLQAEVSGYTQVLKARDAGHRVEIERKNQRIEDLILKLAEVRAPIELRLPDGPKASADKLGLWIRYAYEWRYKDSTHTDVDRAIDSSTPLRTTVGAKARLDLGVFNGNGVPVQDVDLQINFKQAVTVEAQPPWGEMIPGRQYFTRWGVLDSESGRIKDLPLLVTFPRRGTYDVECTIKAFGLPVARRTFTVLVD